MNPHLLGMLTLAIGETPYLDVSRNMGKIVAVVLIMAAILWILQKARGGGGGDRGQRKR